MSGELSHRERGVRSAFVAARVMHVTYLIIPFTVLATVVLALMRHRRTTRRTAGLRYDGPSFALAAGERPVSCAFCGRPVTDEVTHWKAIHHVPA